MANDMNPFGDEVSEEDDNLLRLEMLQESESEEELETDSDEEYSIGSAPLYISDEEKMQELPNYRRNDAFTFDQDGLSSLTEDDSEVSALSSGSDSKFNNISSPDGFVPPPPPGLPPDLERRRSRGDSFDVDEPVKKVDKTNPLSPKTASKDDLEPRKSPENVNTEDVGRSITQKTFIEGINTKQSKSNNDGSWIKPAAEKPRPRAPSESKVPSQLKNSAFRAKMESLFSGTAGKSTSSAEPIASNKAPAADSKNVGKTFKSAQNNLAAFLQKSLNRGSAPAPPTAVPTKEIINKPTAKTNPRKEKPGLKFVTKKDSNKEILKDMVVPPGVAPPGYFSYQFPPLLEEQELIRGCMKATGHSQIEHQFVIEDESVDLEFDFAELKLEFTEVSRLVLKNEAHEHNATADVFQLLELVFLRKILNEPDFFVVDDFKHSSEKPMFDNVVVSIFNYRLMKLDSRSIMSTLEDFKDEEFLVSTDSLVDCIQFLDVPFIRKILISPDGECLLRDASFIEQILRACKPLKMKDTHYIDCGLFLRGIVTFFDAVVAGNLHKLLSDTFKPREVYVSSKMNLQSLLKCFSSFSSFTRNKGFNTCLNSFYSLSTPNNFLIQRSFVEILLLFNDHFKSMNKNSSLRAFSPSQLILQEQNYLNVNGKTKGSNLLKELKISSDWYKLDDSLRSHLLWKTLILVEAEDDHNAIFNGLFLSMLERIICEKFMLPRAHHHFCSQDADGFDKSVYFDRMVAWFDAILFAASGRRFVPEITRSFPYHGLLLLFKNGFLCLLVLNYFLGSLAPIEADDGSTTLRKASNVLNKIGLPMLTSSGDAKTDFMVVLVVLSSIYERFKKIKPSKSRVSNEQLQQAIEKHLSLDSLGYTVQLSVKASDNQSLSDVSSHARRVFLKQTLGMKDPSAPFLRPAPPPPTTINASYTERDELNFDIVEEKHENESLRSVQDTTIADELSYAPNGDNEHLAPAIEFFRKYTRLNLIRPTSCAAYYFRMTPSGRNNTSVKLIWSRNKPGSFKSKYSSAKDSGSLDLGGIGRVELHTNRTGTRQEAFVGLYSAESVKPVVALSSEDGDLLLAQKLFDVLDTIVHA